MTDDNSDGKPDASRRAAAEDAAPIPLPAAPREGSPEDMRGAKREPLAALLKPASRSLYLSIRVLPAPMRAPTGVAYLLARAADAVADAAPLPPAVRLAHLRRLRCVIGGGESAATASELCAALGALAGSGLHDGAPPPASAAEARLLRALPRVLAAFNALPPSDRRLVRKVARTLIDGMRAELSAFHPEGASAPNAPQDSGGGNGGVAVVAALRTPEDLDEYTYMAAGCVGEFWTALTMARIPSARRWDAERMAALGVRFGGALQLTNILRDAAQDLRMGRCLLPRTELARLGLRPENLLDANSGARARPLLAWGIRAALERFCDAERYILALPRRELRLRLAALWPALIGCYTLLALARADQWPDARNRVKVSRRRVYGIIIATLLFGRSDAALRYWMRRVRREVDRAL